MFDALYNFFYSPYWALLAVISVALVLFKPRRRSRHKRNIHSANKALVKLNSINNPAMMFSYIRKIDPFVFEEIILSALSNQGYEITRNKRYTGDGGIDGKAKINGKHILIQAKRYESHINNQHVLAFAQLCKSQKKLGLFVHSGKTGKMAKESCANSDSISIISGTNLLNLLTNKQCTFYWN